MTNRRRSGRVAPSDDSGVPPAHATRAHLAPILGRDALELGLAAKVEAPNCPAPFDNPEYRENDKPENCGLFSEILELGSTFRPIERSASRFHRDNPANA